MDTEVIHKLAEQVASKKTKNYVYIIIFFLIFSFFILFAIRPSLITAISLAKEAEQLETINEAYEKDIVNVLSIQSALQGYQDRLYLLSDALPEKPTLSKLLVDIEKAGQENSLTINKLTFDEVTLSENKDGSLNTIVVNMEASTNYDNLLAFINGLSSQRRIKSIESIDIVKENSEATSSGNLNVNLKIIGYYL